MQCRYINAMSYLMVGDRGLAVPVLWELRPLQLLLEDISIIASLFNCEPSNTQAEVMSPTLVAEYHLFARGWTENASWLEVQFSYFVSKIQ